MIYIGKNVVFPGVQASLQLWVSDLYCFVHSLGHCYTYNPPADGLPSFEGGVGLFLGRAANDPSVFAITKTIKTLC